MKRKFIKIVNYKIAIVLGFFLLGCGGSGGGNESEITPPPPPEPAFKLTLRQETSCDPDAPLPNANVIVHEESPLLNYDVPFKSYTTDANGVLELDLSRNEKVSFSVVSNDKNGDTRIDSFIDLDVGVYDLTVQTYPYSSIEEDCECRIVSVDAVVNTGLDFGSISHANIYWGPGIKSYNIDYSDNVNFRDVEVCGLEQRDYPLVVSLVDNQDNHHYGYKDVSNANDLSTPVVIDYVSLDIEKPVKEREYRVLSWFEIGRGQFLRYGTSSATYKAFTDFSLASPFYILSSPIPATYNGQPDSSDFATSGTLRVRDFSEDSSIDWMPEFQPSTEVNLLHDEENRLFTIESDVINQNSNVKYTYFHFSFLDFSRLDWFIYSPGNTTITMPKLTEDLEVKLAQGSLQESVESFWLVSRAEKRRWS